MTENIKGSPEQGQGSKETSTQKGLLNFLAAIRKKLEDWYAGEESHASNEIGSLMARSIKQVYATMGVQIRFPKTTSRETTLDELKKLRANLQRGLISTPKTPIVAGSQTTYEQGAAFIIDRLEELIADLEKGNLDPQPWRTGSTQTNEKQGDPPPPTSQAADFSKNQTIVFRPGEWLSHLRKISRGKAGGSPEDKLTELTPQTEAGFKIEHPTLVREINQILNQVIERYTERRDFLRADDTFESAHRWIQEGIAAARKGRQDDLANELILLRQDLYEYERILRQHQGPGMQRQAILERREKQAALDQFFQKRREERKKS